jgi:hypothetical protein
MGTPMISWPGRNGWPERPAEVFQCSKPASQIVYPFSPHFSPAFGLQAARSLNGGHGRPFPRRNTAGLHGAGSLEHDADLVAHLALARPVCVVDGGNS